MLCEVDILESLYTVYYVLGFLGSAVVWVAMCKVFVDNGESWWMTIVPVYNVYLVNKWNGNTGWLVPLCLLPYIGTLYLCYLAFQLGRNYGRSMGFSVGCALVPFVFLPIMAFGRGGPGDARAEYKHRPPAAHGDDPPMPQAPSRRPVVSTPAESLPRDLMAPPPGAPHASHVSRPAKQLDENPDVLPELAKYDDEMRGRLVAGESVKDLSWDLLDRTHEISRRDVVAHLQRLKE